MKNKILYIDPLSLMEEIGLKIIRTIIPITFILLAINSDLLAQCNHELVEKAVAKSGTDAIYLKEFKIKFTEDKKNKIAPIAKFNTMLNEGKLYRFTVENASEYEGHVIMQLFDKSNLVGSTYEIEAEADHQTFDYFCEKTGFYRILMTFMEGKKGCAAGVMSLVLNDSTRLSDPILLGIDTIQTLYVGVENPLSIAAAKAPFGYIDVEIDKGEILKKNGFYSAFVREEGKTTINVIVKDSMGNVQEESAFLFRSIKIPSPIVTIGGLSGGIVNKRDLINNRSLQIQPPLGFENLKYTIVRFSISSENEGFEGLNSMGKDFTSAQQNFILNLAPGSKLFIRNILVRAPDGKEQILPPIGFIID